MLILCMIALFLLITRPVGLKMLYSNSRVPSCKGMRWGMLIVERGGGGVGDAILMQF